MSQSGQESQPSDLAARLHLAPIICPQGVRIWLLFHRKFINCPLKHCSIWKKRQFKHAVKAAQISQNWKKTSKRNCSEIMQKVARNTRSCQKVGEQLVESPREKEGGGGGGERLGGYSIKLYSERFHLEVQLYKLYF